MATHAEAQTEKPEPPFPPQHQEKPGKEAELNPAPRHQAPAYKPASKLEDKIALITGGDSGIGRAVALIFAREGARVAISFLPEEIEDAEKTRDVIEAVGGECLLLPGNLTDPKFCEEVIEDVVQQLGGLDILVSNAAHQNRVKLEALTDEELTKTFETNIYALVRLSRNALKHLPEGGAIIATSSETGLLGSKSLSAYSATKGAINAFVKTVAQEVLEKGIRVNAVAPGPVWTPLNVADTGTDPEKVSKFGSQAPIGRPAQPEELAPAYVFLASNADSSYITGIVLEVMGGQTVGG